MSWIPGRARVALFQVCCDKTCCLQPPTGPVTPRRTQDQKKKKANGPTLQYSVRRRSKTCLVIDKWETLRQTRNEVSLEDRVSPLFLQCWKPYQVTCQAQAMTTYKEFAPVLLLASEAFFTLWLSAQRPATVWSPLQLWLASSVESSKNPCDLIAQMTTRDRVHNDPAGPLLCLVTVIPFT